MRCGNHAGCFQARLEFGLGQFFISITEPPLESKPVQRLARQFKRHIRGLHLGSWLLAALIVFVSSDFVLRIPGMVASGSGLHSEHHQQASNEKKAYPSSDQHPASHDHRSCQLCAAPPIALPVSSLSQLGKTRLELVDVLTVVSPELGKQEHRVGLRSRAPPVFVQSV
jgi:hypothetical protein